MKTYEMNLWCRNCGKELKVNIPRGMTVKLWLIRKRCDNCGCSMNGITTNKDIQDHKESI